MCYNLFKYARKRSEPPMESPNLKKFLQDSMVNSREPYTCYLNFAYRTFVLVERSGHSLLVEIEGETDSIDFLCEKAIEKFEKKIIPVQNYLGMADAAKYIGKYLQWVKNRHERGTFPKPDAYYGDNRPLWRKATIDEFKSNMK